MVVIFENEDAENIVGGRQAPYLTSLAQAGAMFTDAHGVTHPSQPNYLALFSRLHPGRQRRLLPADVHGPEPRRPS